MFRVKSYPLTVNGNLTTSERVKVSTYDVLVNGEGSVGGTMYLGNGSHEGSADQLPSLVL